MVPAVNAADLLETLGGRPPASNGWVIFVVTGGPVEVALTRDGSDQGLRKAWRERNQGRATPVLVVHDSPRAGGLIRALGPTDDRSAVREIPVDRLASLLQRISSASRLTASREVSEELQRLDEAGIPGLVVKDLLTRHLLQVRLRTMPDWKGLEESVASLPPSTDWRGLLTGLGYALERRRQRGWLARAEGAPTLVVHPLPDPAAFARLDADGRPPEGILAVDCRAEGVTYGVLASGSRLRLFRSGVNAEPGAAAATTSFLELDAAVYAKRTAPCWRCWRRHPSHRAGCSGGSSRRPAGSAPSCGLDWTKRFGPACCRSLPAVSVPGSAPKAKT